MARNPAPEVGSWYVESEQKQIFEVVALDEEDETIEVQYLDGGVDEFDLDNWRDMTIEEINEPEDWRHAYELSKEDAEELDERITLEDYSDPLNGVEPVDLAGPIED